MKEKPYYYETPIKEKSQEKFVLGVLPMIWSMAHTVLAPRSPIEIVAASLESLFKSARWRALAGSYPQSTHLYPSLS